VPQVQTGENLTGNGQEDPVAGEEAGDQIRAHESAGRVGAGHARDDWST